MGKMFKALRLHDGVTAWRLEAAMLKGIYDQQKKNNSFSASEVGVYWTRQSREVPLKNPVWNALWAWLDKGTELINNGFLFSWLYAFNMLLLVCVVFWMFHPFLATKLFKLVTYLRREREENKSKMFCWNIHNDKIEIKYLHSCLYLASLTLGHLWGQRQQPAANPGIIARYLRKFTTFASTVFSYPWQHQVQAGELRAAVWESPSRSWGSDSLSSRERERSRCKFIVFFNKRRM